MRLLLALIFAMLPIAALAETDLWNPGETPLSSEADNYDIYRVDPCVEAMRKAMQEMEPFLLINPRWEEGYWWGRLQLTEDGMDQLQGAWQDWKETKVQCWRAN